MMSSSSSDQQQQQEQQSTVAVAVDVAANLQDVRDRIQQACAKRDHDNNNNKNSRPVRLVAVSKTKPMELLVAAYKAGCRVFGENYVQELVSKVQSFPFDNDNDNIQWHYIGALQSNKVNQLLKPFLGQQQQLSSSSSSAADDAADSSTSSSRIRIDQLTIETVASRKLATKLNNAIEKALQNTAATASASSSSSSPSQPQLRVFVQVNTSGEDSKSGVEPSSPECMDLCLHITQQCPHLKLCGLMTIGAVGDTTCFTVLRQCRADVAAALLLLAGSVVSSSAENKNDNDGDDDDDSFLELSMGMSGDFEEAIAAGSTNVRVGSTIFGARDYSNKEK